MRKSYETEYKEYVSRMVVEEGRTISELARELSISRGTLYQWVHDYQEKEGWMAEHEQKKGQQPKLYKTPTDYENELNAARKRNEQLERENNILKKAMHVFTENHE